MTRDRYHGLDNWRAILLTIGPLIHSAGAINISNVPWLNDIQNASHLFRMSSFFMIAGFLAAHNQVKAREGWLGHRMTQIVLPLVSLWLLVMIPLDIIQHYWAHTTWLAILSPVHLWFLMVLAVITPVFYAFDGSPLYQKTRNFIDTHPMASLAMGLGVLMVFEFSLNVALHLMKPLTDVMAFLGILIYTPRYLVIYFLGFMAQRATTFQALFKNPLLWIAAATSWLVSILVLHWAYAHGYSSPLNAGKFQIQKMFIKEVTVTTEMLTACAVLASALAWRSKSCLLAWLSGRAYTVYLFHVPFIWILALTFTRFQSNAWYLVIFTAFSLGGSLMVFEVIRRSPTLMLLFNGKRKKS